MMIANVAVCPDFQGNGLGRGLLEFAEAEARKQGITELRRSTHVDLTENISLYRHLGWSESGHEGHIIFMMKILSV